MVLSSALAIASDAECLTYGGFSLGETIHLGSFEFITNYFGGMSLSPRRGSLGATFMGHDRGPCQGIPHGVEWGGGLRPLLSKEAQHGGFIFSCHNHTTNGESSDHPGHDDVSTADSGTAAGYWPPLRARACSS
jgi:hypothetical protein